jgi:hypothetical protein
VRFLIFLAAVLQAGAQARRAAARGHRHGGQRAPPRRQRGAAGDHLGVHGADAHAHDRGHRRRQGEGEHAAQQLIQLGVAKLPEIEKDNTDRNRTSPFAFTGNKFEFRAVGSSQSIAFPVMLLNAAVAEAIEDLTAKLRKQLEATKAVDDAVLAVVRESFRASSAVRFEGNGYSDEWVREAEGRGLKNLRRTPEALEQLVTDEAKALFRSTGILTEAELESRYHVRVERYVKDMLIEVDTLAQLVDTLVLPAAYGYANALARGAAHAKQAGLAKAPQVAAAERVGALVAGLEEARTALRAIIDQAEHTHGEPADCARLLTAAGRRGDGRGARGQRRARAGAPRRAVAAAQVPGDALPGVAAAHGRVRYRTRRRRTRRCGGGLQGGARPCCFRKVPCARTHFLPCGERPLALPCAGPVSARRMPRTSPARLLRCVYAAVVSLDANHGRARRTHHRRGLRRLRLGAHRADRAAPGGGRAGGDRDRRRCQPGEHRARRQRHGQRARRAAGRLHRRGHAGRRHGRHGAGAAREHRQPHGRRRRHRGARRHHHGRQHGGGQQHADDGAHHGLGRGRDHADAPAGRRGHHADAGLHRRPRRRGRPAPP